MELHSNGGRIDQRMSKSEDFDLADIQSLLGLTPSKKLEPSKNSESVKHAVVYVIIKTLTSLLLITNLFMWPRMNQQMTILKICLIF